MLTKSDRHDIAVQLVTYKRELLAKLDTLTDNAEIETMHDCIAHVEDIASSYCVDWFNVDYDNPETLDNVGADTDLLLQLTSANN
jgi:hypothetical protein